MTRRGRNPAAQQFPAISGFASLGSDMLPLYRNRRRAPMLRITLSAFAAALLALGLIPASAQAQGATRVFVAAQGSDGNPCSFAAPCRTFQHAHDTVAAGGEIDVLDPAGYGAVTITKSISIQGHGFSGISAPNLGNGIFVSATAADDVSLNGLP